MQDQVIRAGEHLLNLAYVSGAKWEGKRLYVYLSGGRFMCFEGDEARCVWRAISMHAVDALTGEVLAAQFQ